MKLRFDYLRVLRERQGLTAVVVWNIFGTFFVKGLALFISLMTIPLYILYFDNQTYLGLWFTILSLLSWVLMFDIGLSNGLRNKLTIAIATKDSELQKRLISSSVIAMVGLTIIIAAIFFLTSPYINWNGLFGIDTSVIQTGVFQQCMSVVFIGVLLQFLLKTVSSILYAIQLTVLNNVLALLSTVIIYFLIAFAQNGSSLTDKLLYISWVNVVAMNIPLIIACIWLFAGRLKNAIPSIKYIDSAVMLGVIKLGSSFFYVQVMYMLIMATNEIMIVRLFSAKDVVDYQIYYRIYSLIPTIVSLALMPVWSAITHAHETKDYRWLLRSYKIMLILALGATLLEIVLVFAMPAIVQLWLPDNPIKVDTWVSSAFMVMNSLVIWNLVFATVANGLGRLKVQAVMYTLGFILKLALVFIIIKLFNVSWIVIVLSTAAGLFVYCIVQPIWISRYIRSLKVTSD